MRPAKLLEFPSLWVLVVSVTSAAITVLAVSDQAWPLFSWTERVVGYFNGLRHVVEPLQLKGCDPSTIRAIVAAGLLSFGATAGSTVVAIIATLDFANPAYRPRKPAIGIFSPLVLAKGSVCLSFAALIAWVVWFHSGSGPTRMVDCSKLGGAGFFIGKTVLLSAIVQYLLFTGLRDAVRVTKGMVAS